MQRINWIDWVKAWCMTVVVFCHLPQQEDAFYLQYLSSVILSSFFFVSGYLKKPITSQKETIKKYGYSLLIPYFIYNVLYYPYWIGKTYIEQDRFPSFSDCMKPILGTLLGQLDSSFSCQLNGVTWFLISLFIMHWITDICNHQKNRKMWMLGISLGAMILYGANKYYHFAPYLTFHGLVRCIPFFFLGNLMRKTTWLKEVRLSRDFTIGIVALIISLLLFYWHIHENIFILHIILYFVVNIISIFAIICLCRYANGQRSQIVAWISIGTMIIFGFHRMIMGPINYGLEKAFHLNDIIYTWPEAIGFTILIELILLPIIYYTYQHCPILFGKRKTNYNLTVMK